MISSNVVKNTLLDHYRLETIRAALKDTMYLDGAVAEVGVYKGGTSLYILECTDKHLFVLDTFEGMPPTQAIDLHRPKDFNDTSLEHVTNLLKAHSNFSIYKGVFPKQNAEYLAPYKFSVVHLDVDIYESTKECLEFFYPKMQSGGYIIFDDYTTPSCPGVKKAVDDFLQDKPEKLVSGLTNGQAFLKMI